MSYDKKFEQKDGTGSLFKNEKKQSPKQPDYTGSAKIRGKDTQIAAWVKESKNGKKYFSFIFSDPYVKGGQSSQSSDNEESVPF
jgi:uncharacterized protein (DUF736 family)